MPRQLIGTLEAAVLSVLSCRPMTATEIRVFMFERADHKPDTGYVYVVLRRLHSRGLVSSEWEEHLHTSVRPRAMWSITNDGRKALDTVIHLATMHEREEN